MENERLSRAFEASKEFGKELSFVTRLSMGRVATIITGKNHSVYSSARRAESIPTPEEIPLIDRPKVTPLRDSMWTQWGKVEPLANATEDLDHVDIENITDTSADVTFED